MSRAVELAATPGLDVRLRHQSADPIVQRLLEGGVPFLILTGQGDNGPLTVDPLMTHTDVDQLAAACWPRHSLQYAPTVSKLRAAPSQRSPHLTLRTKAFCVAGFDARAGTTDPIQELWNIRQLLREQRHEEALQRLTRILDWRLLEPR